MCVARLILSFVLILASSARLNSQQTASTPQRDPQAIALAQQSLAAMGGANLPSINDTRTTLQTTTFTSGTATISTEIRTTLGTTNLRIDWTNSDGAHSFVMDSQSATAKDGSDPARFVSRKALSDGGISHLPLLSILADWSNPGTQLEYVGLEKIAATQVHHIRLKRPLLMPELAALEAPADLYFDSQTLFLVRLVHVIRPPGNLRRTETLEIDYSQYKFIAGLAVPFHVSLSLRGNVIRDLQVTDFIVNSGAQAADFMLR
jgi:hypothetical protein